MDILGLAGNEMSLEEIKHELTHPLPHHPQV